MTKQSPLTTAFNKGKKYVIKEDVVRVPIYPPGNRKFCRYYKHGSKSPKYSNTHLFWMLTEPDKHLQRKPAMTSYGNLICLQQFSITYPCHDTPTRYVRLSLTCC